MSNLLRDALKPRMVNGRPLNRKPLYFVLTLIALASGLLTQSSAIAAADPTNPAMVTSTSTPLPTPETPVIGYAGQWENLSVEQAFVRSNPLQANHFVHYRNCAPVNAKQMLWEANRWEACPTDSLLLKVEAGAIKWSVWNVSHPAIEAVVINHKHAGNGQRVVNFTFTNNLQAFGLFMRPQGGNWMLINSPAMSVVVSKTESVEFFALATDPSVTGVVSIDYPRGFSPLVMRMFNEWPHSNDCLRMSASNFLNGEGMPMGGDSAPLRQFTTNKRISGNKLTFSFNYGLTRPFGTWIITQALNKSTGQWVTTDVNLVERGAITLPVNRRYAVLTMFDDPTACGVTEPFAGTNIATLKRVGLWPNR